MAKKPKPAPTPPPAPSGRADTPADQATSCRALPDTVLGDDVALVAENMEAILASPSNSLAQHDRVLMDRPETRGVRMLLELEKAELAFQEHKIHSTVIVFGGTQIVERGAAQRRLSDARRAAAADPDDPRRARDVVRAEKLLARSHYYDKAREFARLVSIDNQCAAARDFVVVTGGGPGIMEAANRGAFDVGCQSIGLNIKLPFEQQPNPFITPDLCFQFKYFALRKFHFILRAAGVVLFPGGFGTLDEMFETLTLRQTNRMQPVPIILFGREYWSGIIDFERLADEGVIADEHLRLFSWAETPEEAWRQIVDFHDASRSC